jgi:lipopolysaccharide export system protein LptA
MSATRSHMVMIHPDIVDTTRGVSHITADRAEESGADIGNSEWVLTGHVRADMSEGQLRADTATIHIVDRQIASITAQGMPALFQRPAQNTAASGTTAGAPAAGAGSARSSGAAKSGVSSLSVRGHADSITYDALHRQVQFRGDSWFSDGCNDITSPLVTYNLGQQSVQAGVAPGGSGRVHGTIRSTRPGSSSGCSLESGHT